MPLTTSDNLSISDVRFVEGVSDLQTNVSDFRYQLIYCSQNIQIDFLLLVANFIKNKLCNKRNKVEISVGINEGIEIIKITIED